MRRPFIERLREEYRDLAPVATRFAETLVAELQQLVQRNELALAVPIEHRVKAWRSIEDKLTQIDFHGASLADLHDLVGIRMILLFKRDLPKACDLVEKTFRLEGRQDKSDALSHEQFGYQSIHFVARPPESWLDVPTFSSFRHLRAELQIRTLAQHMWAAASHKLQYKQEGSVPPPVRRSIHRVSALLETVDLEFDRVLEERDEYRAAVRSEPQSRPLNSDVLEALLDELLPRQNKEAFEPYSLLFWELEKLGITATDDVRGVVNRHLSVALQKDKAAVDQLCERGSQDTRTSAGVYFSHAGLVRLVLEQEYGEDFYGRILERAEQDERSRARERMPPDDALQRTVPGKPKRRR